MLKGSTFRAYNHGLRLLLTSLAEAFPDRVAPAMVELPVPFAVLREALLSIADSSTSNASNAFAAYLSLCKVIDALPPPAQQVRGMWADLARVQTQRPPRKKAPPLPAGHVKTAVLASSVCLRVRTGTNNDLAIRDVMLGLVCFVAMLRKSDAANAYVITDPPSDGNRMFLYIAESKTGPHLVEVLPHPNCPLLDPLHWINIWTGSATYKSATARTVPLRLSFVDGVAPVTRGSAMPLLPCSLGPRMGENLLPSSVKSILMGWLTSWAPSTRALLSVYTTHSWRRGGAQAARDAGVHQSAIHATGHWKDPSTMNRIYLNGVNVSIAGAVFPMSAGEVQALRVPVSSAAPDAMRAAARLTRPALTAPVARAAPAPAADRRPATRASVHGSPASAVKALV